MAFWNSAEIELKVKSKFVVAIAGTFFLPNVKSVTKPSCETTIKEFKMINHVFRYPGIVKWNPITVVFVDMIWGGLLSGFSVSTAIYLSRKFFLI